MVIPCYVSGKGMYATDKTRQFKVAVIDRLEATGVGSTLLTWLQKTAASRRTL